MKLEICRFRAYENLSVIIFHFTSVEQPDPKRETSYSKLKHIFVKDWDTLPKNLKYFPVFFL